MSRALPRAVLDFGHDNPALPQLRLAGGIPKEEHRKSLYPTSHDRNNNDNRAMSPIRRWKWTRSRKNALTSSDKKTRRRPWPATSCRPRASECGPSIARPKILGCPSARPRNQYRRHKRRDEPPRSRADCAWHWELHSPAAEAGNADRDELATRIGLQAPRRSAAVEQLPPFPQATQ